MPLQSRRSLFLAACLAATVPAWGADTPQPVRTPAVADRLASARQAIAAGSWTVALRELDAAARGEPRNADVQNCWATPTASVPRRTCRRRSSTTRPRCGCSPSIAARTSTSARPT